MEKRLHVESVFLKYDFTCFYINILDSVPERSRLAVRFLRNELGQGAVVPFAVHLLFPFLITLPIGEIISVGVRMYSYCLSCHHLYSLHHWEPVGCTLKMMNSFMQK